MKGAAGGQRAASVPQQAGSLRRRRDAETPPGPWKDAWSPRRGRGGGGAAPGDRPRLPFPRVWLGGAGSERTPNLRYEVVSLWRVSRRSERQSPVRNHRCAWLPRKRRPTDRLLLASASPAGVVSGRKSSPREPGLSSRECSSSGPSPDLGREGLRLEPGACTSRDQRPSGRLPLSLMFRKRWKKRPSPGK